MNKTRFIARSGFLTREIAGEYMLVPVDTGKVYATSDETSDGTDHECLIDEFNGMVQLDDVGLFIWELLSEPRTGEEIIDLVKQEFDTGGQDITEDIMGFLNKGFMNHIIFILNEES